MASTGKQKRKIFFTIGDSQMNGHIELKVGGGRFTKRTRNHNAKIIK
jgi:hypothetical protein